MGSQARKARLFDGFASVGKALSSGRRLELLDVLAQGPRSVEQVAHEIGQSVANTSAHLQVLLRAGLVDTERDGNRVVYRLAGEAVEDLWAALRATAEAHAVALDRLATDYLGDRAGLETITRAELAERLRREPRPVVLDVRPAAEFLAGHLPGAVSVAPADVVATVERLPRAADVVAYCRGPFCIYADDAVRALRRRGHPAVRLEDGFPEWRRAGLPVESGDPAAAVETGRAAGVGKASGLADALGMAGTAATGDGRYPDRPGGAADPGRSGGAGEGVEPAATAVETGRPAGIGKASGLADALGMAGTAATGDAAAPGDAGEGVETSAVGGGPVDSDRAGDGGYPARPGAGEGVEPAATAVGPGEIGEAG